MPIIPDEERTVGCPYCYDGTIEFDKYSELFYCSKCQKTVKILKYKNKKKENQ